MTVIIGNNYNLIADILSLIIIGCLYGYAFNKMYKQGYRDGKDGVIEDTPIKEGGAE